jgi:hypothetical protein
MDRMMLQASEMNARLKLQLISGRIGLISGKIIHTENLSYLSELLPFSIISFTMIINIAIAR